MNHDLQLSRMDRGALTPDERAFLKGVARLDPEARERFLIAFGQSVKAETDTEALAVIEDFRQWLEAHREKGAAQ